MFGYVSINKPEMKVREYEVYKAIYCGLCRRLEHDYGLFAKLVLNYDLTFVSLLQMAVSSDAVYFERKRCRANCFKKCTYCKDDGKHQALAAAACVALFDLKVEDSVNDSRFFKALMFRVLRVFSKCWAKRAFKLYPKLQSVINDYRLGQRKAEADDHCSIDAAAEPTALAVCRILSMIECQEKYKFVLERMGYCLGKWIYLCDAVDDLKRDVKSGNFNVLKPYGSTAVEVRDRVEPILNNCWTECAKYSELLEIEKYHSIIENILYEGLKNRQIKLFKEEFSK